MRCKLGNIIKINQYTYTSHDQWKYVNYLDTGNITKNVIDTVQYINLSKEVLPSRARRKVKKNSILYSMVRPNQSHYGIVKDNIDNFLVSTGFAVIDVDTNKTCPAFIYYMLTQQKMTEHLQAIAEQSVSAYPSIKPSDIENLDIILPGLLQQQKIAKLLGALDDKIELNRQINTNLEQQVLAYYNYLFIDNYNVNRRKCRMNEYFDISIGKTPPRQETQWFKTQSNDVVWVSISDMAKCGLYINKSSEQLTKEAIKKFNIPVVPDNTLLLSFKLTIGRIAITNGALVTNEAIAHFKTDQKIINEYLYCYLKRFDYDKMGNTSSIAVALNSRLIKEMPFIIPESHELQTFYDYAHCRFQYIKANLSEINTLSTLRDALLPKLMSGEIDVSRIELE